jgi:hypothetical protein
MASVACLIVMPDQCALPDRKRKPEGELPRVASVAKSDSASSLASCRSDAAYSKASEGSSASSNCSFKPVVSRSPEAGKRSGVRIAIGGA